MRGRITPLRPGLSLILVLAILLAACGDDNTPASPTVTPAPPTRPPVVTVIVPPPPSPTPSPVPTLAFDIIPVAGDWFIRVQASILDSDFIDELRYEANLRMRVDLNGMISGQGFLFPHPDDADCTASPLGDAALGFSISGMVRQDGNELVADLSLVPDDPAQLEHYALECHEDYADRRYLDQPVLWPALEQFNLLNWTVPLRSGVTATGAGSLADNVGAPVNGELSFEMILSR